MIHWLWAPVMFIIGALFGLFLAALIAANNEDGDDK